MTTAIVNMFILLQGEVLETVTTAIVYLFTSQSSMLDQLPQLGYIPIVFQAMSHRNNAVPKSAIQVAHQLAHNEVSIQVFQFEIK